MDSYSYVLSSKSQEGLYSRPTGVSPDDSFNHLHFIKWKILNQNGNKYTLIQT